MGCFAALGLAEERKPIYIELVQIVYFILHRSIPNEWIFGEANITIMLLRVLDI